MPKNIGFSPGAVFSDIPLRALTWVKLRTVAATNHGSPKIDDIAIITPKTIKSRWYPCDFY